VSNLADGYPVTALVGGWQVPDFARLAVPGAWDVGLCALGLNVVGVLRALRGPFIVVAATWATGLVLASSTETPLHTLLFHVLPGFARLHPHVSERVLIVTYFAPALLAGLGFQVLTPRLQLVVPMLVLTELFVAGRMGVDQQIGARWDGITRVPSYESAFAPTAAAQFLQTQAGPFRYLGYAPLEAGQIVPYTQRFADSAMQALLVNNRALALGLEDVQGYNAVHLARFDAYLRELNAGQTQNYHDGQVFAPGLDSPLLDLMGVRYMLVAPDDQSAADLVYSDPQVRVLERPRVLPRSWLVQDAQIASAADALHLIDSGAVDPRQTVLLEQTAVDLAARYVVFGEVAYPGWTAYVDGQPVQPILADGVVQAVPLPPGDHTVELRFESITLRAGLAVSMASFLVLLVCNAGARTGRRAARIARATDDADRA
jgi:hypothetical protein